MAVGTEMSPAEIVGHVTRRARSATSAIQVYWLVTLGDRESLREQIIKEAENVPVVPVVVRGRVFENPNAVGVDLVEVLRGERQRIVTDFDRMLPLPKWVCVVLLSRSGLDIPQVSSPATFPDWFPLVGGRSFPVVVENLSWSAGVALNAAEARIEEISAALFRLEGRLVDRLWRSWREDHRRVGSFFAMIRRGEEKYQEFLEGVEGERLSVRNPESFRPSVRKGRSLVARLWELALKSSQDKVPTRAKSLVQALGIAEAAVEGMDDGILTVIARPRQLSEDARVRFGQNILVSISASCQLVTAAAHADKYPKFPRELMYGLASDLLGNLRGLEERLAEF